MPGMISCQQFDTFLSDYIDGDLSDSQQELFQYHMAMCPMCKAHFNTYIDTYKATGIVFGSSEETVSEEIPEELITAILETAQKNSGK